MADPWHHGTKDDGHDDLSREPNSTNTNNSINNNINNDGNSNNDKSNKQISIVVIIIIIAVRLGFSISPPCSRGQKKKIPPQKVYVRVLFWFLT